MRNLIALFLAAAVLWTFPAHASAIGNPIVSVQSAAAEASHVLKASPGVLNGFSVTSGASAGYILLFDAVTAPSNGSVTPRFCYQIPASSTLAASWLSYPVPFTTGIVIEFSTTGCFTAASSATAFFSAQVQ